MKSTLFLLTVLLMGVVFSTTSTVHVLAYGQHTYDGVSHQQRQSEGVQHQVVYESAYGNGQPFGYLEYLPADYDKNSAEYPLIISLHGLDQRASGEQIEFSKIEKGGQLARRIIEGQDFPFIIITPQQPEDVRGRYQESRLWDPYIIDEVLERVKSVRRVDLNRIYICGESMGGGGVWKYLELFGDKIAAAVPIAGTNTLATEAACNNKIKNTPVWAFHCDRDAIISVESTLDIIESINQCNPPIKAKQTIFSSRSHNAWDWTYDFNERALSSLSESSKFGPASRTQDIFSWMLSHRLKADEKNEEPVANEDEKDTVSIIVDPVEKELHGLRYRYFEGAWTSLPDFADLQPKEEGVVTNFTLAPRNSDDHFAFHYEGYLAIDQEGEYEFFTTSDNGSRLYIDGQLIVDNDGEHSLGERQGKLVLGSGMHTIELLYFERQGSEILEVSYSGPGFNKRNIPSDKLFIEIEHPTLNCGENHSFDPSLHHPSLDNISLDHVSLNHVSLNHVSLDNHAPHMEDFIKAYPTHLDNELMIAYTGVGAKEYTFVLYDQSGRILYMGSALVSEWQNLQIDLLPIRIPKGLVYLRVEDETGVQVIRLFKL